MNRNGTPAIILTYLLIALSGPVDGSKGQSLAANATALSAARTNLYAMFKDKLNATASFAQSEYDARIEKMIGRIYDTAGQILEEQLEGELENEQEQRKRSDNSQTANYADKSSEGPDSLSTHDILPPAVAPLFAHNVEAGDAERFPQLIIAQIVDSGEGSENQHEARAAHRSIKGSRNLRPSRHRTKKIYSRWKMSALNQSSRPQWMAERIQPTGGSEQQELPSLQSNLREVVKENGTAKGNSIHAREEQIDADGLPESHGECESGWMKLQSRSRRKNLYDYTTWPTHLNGPQKSEGVICPSKTTRERGESNNGDERIRTRSADTFPEVFVGTGAPDTSSMRMISTGNGLSEALRSAKTLLASVPNIPVAIGDNVSQGGGEQTSSAKDGAKTGEKLRFPDSNAANLTKVMEKVLDDKETKREGDSEQAEGSPCDIIGTWNSETIGLQFHISLEETSPATRSFAGGRKLEIEITDRIPPRQHDLMTGETYLTGAVVKQLGGPFYITAEMVEKSAVATFSGICRVCGNIPTVFGTWTFVRPAKDCSDISLAVDNKRDVLRKDTMALKRKHRLDRLRGRPGKRSSCSYNLFN